MIIYLFFLQNLFSELYLVYKYDSAMWNKKLEKRIDSKSPHTDLSAVMSKNHAMGNIGKSYLTKFTEPEMFVLHRLVQQECINGLISEERLMKVYTEMFPMGKVSKYVKLVFNTMDHDRSGFIKCGQFISIIARGSTRERAVLCFHMFDVGREGVLSKQDFAQVYKLIREK